MKKIMYGVSCVMLLCSIAGCGIKGDLMRPSDAIKQQQEKAAKAANE